MSDQATLQLDKLNREPIRASFGLPDLLSTRKDRMLAQIRQVLLDLTSADREKAVKYFLACENDIGFVESKRELLRYIVSLEGSTKLYPVGSPIRINIKARLANFERIVRGFIPISELMNTASKRKPETFHGPLRKVSLDELQTGTYELRPDELPEEVKTVLKGVEIRPGYSGWQMIKDDLNFVILAPRLERTIKMVPREGQGTTDELTRTVFVDSMGEMFDFASPAWSIATRIIHETEHVKWYYKHGDDLKMMSLEENERNSELISILFLKKLLVSGVKLSDDERVVIAERIDMKKDMVRAYNKTLHRPEGDFELRL